MRRALTTDVPYGAQIELSRVEAADGWHAPDTAPWLRDALDDASDSRVRRAVAHRWASVARFR